MDPKSKYNIRKEKDHTVYARRCGKMTIENHFPNKVDDMEQQLESIRYLAAQVLLSKNNS
ncbi:hypothetical protein [Desulfoscipio gibsoniae]